MGYDIYIERNQPIMTNLADQIIERYTNTIAPDLTFDELVDELVDGITEHTVVDQMNLPEYIEEECEELYETLEELGLDVLDADTLKEAWETQRANLAPIVERLLNLATEADVRNQIEATYRQFVEEEMTQDEMEAMVANW